MSKHRDQGTDYAGAYAYIGMSGDLHRVKYEPYEQLYRAEYGLPPRKVEIGVTE